LSAINDIMTARTFASLKNGAGLFLKASLFEIGLGLMRPLGLSFANWRLATRVSPRDHDQIKSGLDY